MLAGLVLLEALSILLFAALLVRQQTKEVHQRMVQGLAHQVTSMALQAKEALIQNQPGWVGLSVKMTGESPSVALALVTDPAGNVLFVSEGVPEQVTLNPVERSQIPLMTRDEPRVFTLGKINGRVPARSILAAISAALPGSSGSAPGIMNS